MNYTLPTSVNIDGIEHPIRSDYRVILDIISALNDDDFTDREKAIAMMRLFFVDAYAVTDWEKGLKAAAEFIACGRDEGNTKRPRVIDWDKDFPYMVSAINKVAGREIRADSYCHWWTFIGYFDAIDGESTFANIVNIRNKKAKGKKLEKWEQEFYNANRDLCDIKSKQHGTSKESLAALCEAFAAEE